MSAAFRGEIVLSKESEIFFKFSQKKFRTSIWILDARFSTFAEIVSDDTIVIGEVLSVSVKYGDTDFWREHLLEGTTFSIGVFPLEIGVGKIIALLP